MTKNIEAINKILVESGKEPLKEETTNDIIDDKDANKVDDIDPEKKEEIKIPATLPELDDAAVLNYLQTKKGMTVSSFEELTTPKAITQAELDKQAEQAEAAKISWALQSGKTTAKQWQKYAAAQNNPVELVYADFRDETIGDDEEIKELLKTNPAEAEIRIKEEFEEKYGLNADKESRKYKRGQTEIGVLANEIIRTNYKDVLDIDNAYAEHLRKSTETDTYNKKILTQAPLYKKDVEDVFAELKTVPFDFGNGEVYEIPVQPEMLKNLKDKLLESGFSETKIASGWTKGEIADIVNTAALKQNYAFLSLEAAKKYHLKRQSGSRGIPDLQSRKVNDNGRKELTDAQKQILTEAGRTDLVQQN